MNGTAWSTLKLLFNNAGKYWRLLTGSLSVRTHNYYLTTSGLLIIFLGQMEHEEYRLNHICGLWRHIWSSKINEEYYQLVFNLHFFCKHWHDSSPLNNVSYVLQMIVSVRMNPFHVFELESIRLWTSSMGSERQVFYENIAADNTADILFLLIKTVL